MNHLSLNIVSRRSFTYSVFDHGSIEKEKVYLCYWTYVLRGIPRSFRHQICSEKPIYKDLTALRVPCIFHSISYYFKCTNFYDIKQNSNAQSIFKILCVLQLQIFFQYNSATKFLANTLYSTQNSTFSEVRKKYVFILWRTNIH